LLAVQTKPTKMTTKILVNHIGFLCNSSKKVVVQNDVSVSEFTVQDMALVASESFDDDENWQTIFTGKLEKVANHDGDFYVGDFSAVRKAGVYAVVLPELKKRSYQFVISDGVFHELPWLFADFLHKWCGTSEFALKVKSTTDDGIRSDNGKYHPVKSGWYDAGDLRKWMTHTNLLAIGFYDLLEKLNFRRNYFHEQNLFDNDLLTVSDEAINLILEMQDPETGKIFECLGAGGFGRADENMSWWYENHSGCLADNSDNRFTDNKIKSGDERTIRTNYNALIQYTSIYILLRAFPRYQNIFPEKADIIYKAVLRIWQNTQKTAPTDDFEKRTAIKSWKLMAANELFKQKIISETELKSCAKNLLINYKHRISFWCMDEKMDDPYRGILHSAQPIIALIKFLELDLSKELKQSIQTKILACWENYIQPLCKISPFGFMPYGTFFQPATEKDIYTPFENGLFYRRFMPDNSKQKINHGLNGHYSSWSHALAMMGNYFDNQKMKETAWNQLFWTLGFNDFNASFVSGVGFNNPMPHSRFLGTTVGGCLIGFIGKSDDKPFVDMEAKAQWNSVEYWVTPSANFCMALAELLPKEIKPENKLGRSL